MYVTTLHNITLIFTFSLHLTTMCLRHPPKIVACVCIHLACKWSNYKIPLSKLKKEWFMHVLEPNWNMDSATTLNLLEELTNEFLTIFEQCPSRLKKKIMASTQAVSIIGLLINRVDHLVFAYHVPPCSFSKIIYKLLLLNSTRRTLK